MSEEKEIEEEVKSTVALKAKLGEMKKRAKRIQELDEKIKKAEAVV